MGCIEVTTVGRKLLMEGSKGMHKGNQRNERKFWYIRSDTRMHDIPKVVQHKLYGRCDKKNKSKGWGCQSGTEAEGCRIGAKYNSFCD